MTEANNVNIKRLDGKVSQKHPLLSFKATLLMKIRVKKVGTVEKRA